MCAVLLRRRCPHASLSRLFASRARVMVSRVFFFFQHLTKAKGTPTTSAPGGESATRLAPKRRASYDLKGCNDDKILERDGERLAEVHKRIWQVHLWCGACCWSDARKAYYAGKREAFREQFHVTPAQKDDLMQWLRTAVKNGSSGTRTRAHKKERLAAQGARSRSLGWV